MKKVGQQDLAHFTAILALRETVGAKRRALTSALTQLHNNLRDVEELIALGSTTNSIEAEAHRRVLTLAIELAEDLYGSLPREVKLAYAEALLHLQTLPNKRGRPRRPNGPNSSHKTGGANPRRPGRPRARSPEIEQDELEYFLNHKVGMEASAGAKVADIRVAEDIVEHDPVVQRFYQTKIKRLAFAGRYAKLISRWRGKYGRPLRPPKSLYLDQK